MPRNNIKSAQLTTFAANTLGVSGAYKNVQICILFLFLTLYIGPMSVPTKSACVHRVANRKHLPVTSIQPRLM